MIYKSKGFSELNANFIAREIDDWAKDKNITIHFTTQSSFTTQHWENNCNGQVDVVIVYTENEPIPNYLK